MIASRTRTNDQSGAIRRNKSQKSAVLELFYTSLQRNPAQSEEPIPPRRQPVIDLPDDLIKPRSSLPVHQSTSRLRQAVDVSADRSPLLLSLLSSIANYLTVHGLSLVPSQSPESDLPDSAQGPPPVADPPRDLTGLTPASPAHNSA